MRTIVLCALGAISLVIAGAGCDSEKREEAPKTPSTSEHTKHRPPAKKSSPWNLVMTAVAQSVQVALEYTHDGTGWLLGKNQINIERVGEVRQQSDGTYMADFKISVLTSNESFLSDISNIACDEFGIPSEPSQEKIAEVAGKIKQLLSNTQ